MISQALTKLLAIIVASVSTCHNAAATCSSEFLTQPTDIIVMEGANATFTCSVSGFNQQTDSLFWVVIQPSIYQMNNSEEYDPYTKEMISTLILFNIDRRNQKQLCVLKRSSAGHQQVCQSKIATFTTWYFPKEDEISCGPQKVTTIEDPQHLTIWCRTDKGNPPVDVSWKIEGGDIPYTETFSNDSTIAITTNLTDLDLGHNKTITCMVSGSGNFGNKAITCDIGPFRINSKPLVLVNPPNFIITPFHRTVQLTCVSNVDPATADYLWSCTPSGIIDGCNTTNENMELTMTQKSLSFLRENFIMATCSARTSKGMASSSSRISLLNTSFSSNCSNIQIKLVQVNETFSLDGELYGSFKCTVQDYTFQHDEQNLFWYYRNKLMPEKSEQYSYNSNEMSMESTIRLISNNLTGLCSQLVCKFVSKLCIVESDHHILCDNRIINTTDMKYELSEPEISLIPVVNTTPQEPLSQASNKTQLQFITIMVITFILLLLLIPTISTAAVCKYLKHVHTNELSNDSQVQLDKSRSTMGALQQQPSSEQHPTTSCPSTELQLEPVYEDPPLSIQFPLPTSTDDSNDLTYLYDSKVYQTSTSSSVESSARSGSPSTSHGSFRNYSSLSESGSLSSESKDTTGRSGPFYENQQVIQMHSARHIFNDF